MMPAFRRKKGKNSSEGLLKERRGGGGGVGASVDKGCSRRLKTKSERERLVVVVYKKKREGWSKKDGPVSMTVPSL